MWQVDVMNGNSLYTNYFRIIEGVGTTKGPWFAAFPDEFENGFTLNCFYNNGIHPILSPAVKSPTGYLYNNDKSCELSVDEQNLQRLDASVVPNPITNDSKILLPNMLQKGYIYITDMLGRQLYAEEIRNKKEVRLGHIRFSPGTYFYRIVDYGNSSFTGSFVYQ